MRSCHLGHLLYFMGDLLPCCFHSLHRLPVLGRQFDCWWLCSTIMVLPLSASVFSLV